MKKAIKTMSKFLAVFLSILFIVEILPTQVMAEAYSAYSAEKQYINDLIDKPAELDDVEKADILYEVTEKRDEHTKVYKRADGTYTALVSQTPLHFMSGGVWKEIDNTLVSKNGALTNADNPFNVTLPERITSNSQITLENDGNEIAFAVNDISASESKIVDTKADVTEEFEAAVANTKSEVKYENVAEDTDIEYVVLPSGIKENIIISDAASIKDTYSFDIEIGNLSYKLNDNNSLDITDANGEVKFTIPAPVMTDSNLALSYDIGVSVTDNNNGTITLVYAPSKEWTGASERSYPITIDPAILSDIYSDNLFEDTVVYYDSSDSTRANTNYFDDGLVAIGDYIDNNTTYKSEVYTRVNTELLQNFGDSAVITDAQYVIGGIAMGSRMYAKTLTSPVDMETVTYNLKPDTSNLSVIDYYTAPRALGESANDTEFLHFNITKQLNDWLDGSTNYGMAIVPDSDFLAMGYINGHVMNSSVSSVLILDFVYVNGYNDLYNYHSQDIGRAGTGYVNDFTRSMSLIRNDLSIPGNIMPVSIDMVYNPALFDYFTMNSGESAPNICGNNWLPNYYRFVQYTDEMQIHYFTETGSEIDFIAQTGENDEITFVDSHAEYIGDSGYTAEILEAPENYEGNNLDLIQITRPDGYIERFNEYGALISITNPDYIDQHINVYYTTINGVDCIDYITDGVERKYDFDYNPTTGLLSDITCKSPSSVNIKAGTTNDDLKVIYGYVDGYLTTVTFADGKNIEYFYDNGLLTSAKNIDGYKIVYTYGTDKKVSNVNEYASSNNHPISGKAISYTALNSSQIQITDNSVGSTEIYQFNNSGKLMYVCDNYGKQISLSDSSTDEDYCIISGLKGVNSTNLLKNGDFESINGWSGSSGVELFTTPNALSGTQVLKVDESAVASVWKTQTYGTRLPGYYTFSAYVYSVTNNGDNSTANLKLSITASNDLSGAIGSDVVTVNGITSEWQRYTVSVNAGQDVNEIKVRIELNNGQGTYYIDNAQLEYSSSASEFNLVNNGSFMDNSFHNNLLMAPTGIWCPSDSNDTNIVTDNKIGRPVEALKINGDVNGDKTVSQKVSVNGTKGDVYSVGAWLKGNYVRSESNSEIVDLLNTMEAGKFNFTGDRYARIEASYQYSEEDENHVVQSHTETISVSFEQLISGWQFAGSEFVLKGDTDQIIVTIRYTKNANEVYVTDVQLNLDTKAVAYETTGVEEITEEENACPCEGCEEIDCACTCVDEEHCNCIQCKRRSGVTTEDTFGNTLTNTSFDGVYSIITSETFTSDGNYSATSTDADGNTIAYDYNPLNGILQSLTDARNNTTNYAYDAYGLLTGVSALNNNVTSSAAYTYTNDRLTAINHNGFSYNFTYDIWGQLIQVSVENQPIISYTYGSGANHDKLIYFTYHNGSGSDVTYRNYYTSGNITSINVNDVEKYRFTYDAFGELTQVDAVDRRTVKYTEGRTDIYDYNTSNLVYSSLTNDNGQLIEEIGGLTYTTTNYDSDYTASTGITVQKSDYEDSDGRVVGTITNSDWFGRTEQEVVKTESAIDDNPLNNYAAITTTYGYPSYTNNETSEQVSYITNRVTHGTDTSVQKKFYGFSYVYDANGNIITENKRQSNGVNVPFRTYVYDELNQLVRVNEVNENTCVYEYDNAGNILYKRIYNYTTNEVITDPPEETITYSYDSTWKDRLSSFDGNTLTYDGIGNPVTIGNDTLTWEGRELKTYTKGNKTYSFSYDENGLRHKKTMSQNGVVQETYNYVWSDGKLISLKLTDASGIYYVKFIYSYNGSVQGFVYDDTTYLYVRNLQGDIVAIIDENGKEVAGISYDVWGNIQYSIGDVSYDIYHDITSVNPFTYRGYCYDKDIMLYYLQSRYYSPAIGRFINTDDTQIAVDTCGDFLGANLFAYCENNPINYVDYTGYKYNRSNVVTYAKKWTKFELQRNLKFRPYERDCANFVSQCLYMGGIAMTGKWYNKLKVKVNIGSNPSLNLYSVTDSWVTVAGLITFITSKKYAKSVTYAYFSTNDYLKRVKSVIDFCKRCNSEIKIGDVMFFWYNNKSYYSHATIITGITSTEIYFSAHSSARFNQALSEKLKGVYGICIVHIRDDAS